MTARNIIGATGRLALGLFFTLTSIYCLLAYLPGTYQQVVQGGLLPWLSGFALLHGKLFCAALALAAVAADRRRLPFLGVHGALALAAVVHPLLPGLRNDWSSYLWSLAPLGSAVWLGWLELQPMPARGVYTADDRRTFRAAWQSGLAVTAIYSGKALAAAQAPLLVLVFSLAAHLLIFLGLFVVLHLLRGVARLTAAPDRFRFLLDRGLAVVLGIAVLNGIVFRPLSFVGPAAWLYAALLAIALTLLAGGLRFPRMPLPVALAGIGMLAWWLAVRSAAMDWNYLLQKLSALGVWALTFACLYGLAARPREAPRRYGAMLAAAVLALGCYQLLAFGGAAGPQAAAALDRYAGHDASYRVVRDLLAPAPKGRSFYKFLSRSTNIPRSVRLAPVDIQFVSGLGASPGVKPNIFVFVIDSLRRDYLSPYNRAVTFTPEVEAFARESVVFRKAFTRYGGTGLSEPSIWTGGMLVHQQYVTPFAPMNTLEKLLHAEGYQSFISMDTVLRTVVTPHADLSELDRGRANMSYAFSTSLAELQARLAERGGGAAPVFAYTQPQDIHVSVIQREGAGAIDGESYGSFHAPYASRVRRVDRSFGEFVRFLKQRNLYDNSVVILTADHGDSLGEEGRWGHAYTIYPEVMRIPLIVHLPARWSGQRTDPEGVVWLTDLTPTLYGLLGHPPVRPNHLFGRPLFGGDGPLPAEGPYLVASSYAAVYGILESDGRTLYIADAVNLRDSVFQLGDNTASGRAASPAAAARYQPMIQRQLAELNAFYGFRPQP